MLPGIATCIKHGNNEHYLETPSNGNRPVQRVEVGEFSRHKWVKKSLPVYSSCGIPSEVCAIF